MRFSYSHRACDLVGWQKGFMMNVCNLLNDEVNKVYEGFFFII
jgi:hypothetical protein